MNELNMAIYTGKNDKAELTNKVTLTASFATHEEAVDFHTEIADVCKNHSIAKRPPMGLLPWIKK